MIDEIGVLKLAVYVGNWQICQRLFLHFLQQNYINDFVSFVDSGYLKHLLSGNRLKMLKDICTKRHVDAESIAQLLGFEASLSQPTPKARAATKPIAEHDKISKRGVIFQNYNAVEYTGGYSSTLPLLPPSVIGDLMEDAFQYHPLVRDSSLPLTQTASQGEGQPGEHTRAVQSGQLGSIRSRSEPHMSSADQMAQKISYYTPFTRSQSQAVQNQAQQHVQQQLQNQQQEKEFVVQRTQGAPFIRYPLLVSPSSHAVNNNSALRQGSYDSVTSADTKNTQMTPNTEPTQVAQNTSNTQETTAVSEPTPQRTQMAPLDDKMITNSNDINIIGNKSNRDTDISKMHCISTGGRNDEYGGNNLDDIDSNGGNIHGDTSTSVIANGQNNINNNDTSLSSSHAGTQCQDFSETKDSNSCCNNCCLINWICCNTKSHTNIQNQSNTKSEQSVSLSVNTNNEIIDELYALDTKQRSNQMVDQDSNDIIYDNKIHNNGDDHHDDYGDRGDGSDGNVEELLSLPPRKVTPVRRLYDYTLRLDGVAGVSRLADRYKRRHCNFSTILFLDLRTQPSGNIARYRNT